MFLYLQAYYTSFASVAFVVYFLRTRKGYRSLPEAIHDRQGLDVHVTKMQGFVYGWFIGKAVLGWDAFQTLVMMAACRYGTLAVISFGLAVAFRLYQEVWSNAIVIAGFFGAEVR